MSSSGTERRRKPSCKKRQRKPPWYKRRPSREVLTAITVALIGIAGELVKQWIERGGRF